MSIVTSLQKNIMRKKELYKKMVRECLGTVTTSQWRGLAGTKELARRKCDLIAACLIPALRPLEQ